MNNDIQGLSSFKELSKENIKKKTIKPKKLKQKKIYNSIVKIITTNIGPFSWGGLEKPNPARTIDTLADGS